MSTWVIALFIIAFLILIHELGHFLAAKWMGVKVEEFSIGFPPRIISKNWGQTRYSIGMLLFGGFVRMRGQNIDDENINEPDNYAAKKVWQRVIIVLAGPLINIALAIIIIPFAYNIGFMTPAYLVEPKVIIEKVEPASAAEKLGFINYDQILELNGTKINSWQEFIDLSTKSNQPWIIAVKNNLDSSASTRLISVLTKQFIGAEFGITPLSPPIIGNLLKDWPAALAGLQKGDRIIKLANQDVYSFSDISRILNENHNNSINIEYIRPGNSEKISTAIIARFDNDSKSWRLGFSSATVTTNYPFWQSIILGWQNILRLNSEIWKFFGRLFGGQVSSHEVGGPIMIVKVIGEASNQGLSALIVMMAIISFQLGIFNLLPLPVLDGGHIILLIWELIIRKPVPVKLRTRVQTVGIVLLLGLMIFATIQDILRL